MSRSAYVYVMGPMYCVSSVPPNVNAPIWFGDEVMGSRLMETTSDWIVPWLKRLSVTVGMVAFVLGDKVPRLERRGPSL